MTSFTVTSFSNAARTLTTGETGFVSTAGALVVTSGSAITTTGGVLTLLGAVTSFDDHAINATSGGANILIGAAGHVSSQTDTAIELSVTESVVISNAGVISGAGRAISVERPSGSGGVTLTNTGDITGGSNAINIGANAGSVGIVNSGTISGMIGAISMSAAANTFFLSFVNSGTIQIANRAQFTTVALQGEVVDFTNSGTILGKVVVTGNTTSQTSTYSNTGLIDGDLTTGNGADTIDTRFGTITGTIRGSGGNDTYLIGASGGTIVELAGGGTDTVRSTVSFTLAAQLENLVLEGEGNSRGTGNAHANQIIGNAGDNVIEGKGGADDLRGGDGNDFLRGGVGDDFLIGGAGDDTIHGGQGNDTLDYLGETASITVDLVAGIAWGDDIGYDVISGIEAVTAGEGNDTVWGNAAANLIQAGGGNDWIDGGAGNDTLRGDLGRDTLTGGAGLDDFVFMSVAESGFGNGVRDIITDFNLADDRIDLSFIDAVAGGGDDAFSFLGGGAFSGVAGQLRAQKITAQNFTVIMGDVDGDTVADFQIELTGLYTLTAAQFIL